VHQKGIDLVLSVADEIIDSGGQIVVTGAGEHVFEQALVDAHRRRPNSFGVAIGFNDGQARRIFAGSDVTLMPSRFEPCGLSQMYAQRFGSLPIGHQTGGLAETITDGETGFLFKQPSIESFLGGVRRAFSTFMSQERLDSMRRRAMARNFQLGFVGNPLRRALPQDGLALIACASCFHKTGAILRDHASQAHALLPFVRRVSGINSAIIASPRAATAAKPRNATVLPRMSLT
jgi:hypothetical protein